ncbi:MAG TPA: hypothetical protein VLG66_00125 [Alphaproteobacteria bacterium]|nr:hypothetical protein [Alphaproteobacteria bacterium]
MTILISRNPCAIAGAPKVAATLAAVPAPISRLRRSIADPVFDDASTFRRDTW